MDRIFFIENNILKIEGLAPKDKMKLFLNISPKIPKEASVVLICIDANEDELENKSNRIKDGIEIPSITLTNNYESANKIISDYEIDAIFFDGKKDKDKLNFTSELIIGGKDSFDYGNIDFCKIKKDIFSHFLKNQNITESTIYTEIVNSLKNKVDIARCNHGVIKDFSKELIVGNAINERRILKGEEPVKGNDGKLLLLSKKYTGVPEITFDSNDNAHYHSLRLFDNIRVGQKVARIYKPKPGKPGIDILGKIIPAEMGDEFIFELCENLKLEHNSNKPYSTIVSKSYGYLTENNGVLKLHSEFIVDGDLNLRYGNINFVGSVSVTGNVLRGFSIKANEGIKINGDVEEANLQSANGSIVVGGYSYGGRNSLIRAGKDFICNIAHELNVEAKNNIVIKKESIDSNLYAQGSTLVDSGVFIGGQILAANGVQIFEAGNDLEKETKIYLASSVEATKEYGELIESIEKHNSAINLLNAHLGPIAENPNQIISLSGTFKKNMEELLFKKNKIQKSLDGLNEKKEKMLENATYSESQKVNFLHKVYGGIKILCKEVELLIDQEKTGSLSFSYDEENNEVKEIDFEKIEIQIEE